MSERSRGVESHFIPQQQSVNDQLQDDRSNDEFGRASPTFMQTSDNDHVSLPRQSSYSRSQISTEPSTQPKTQPRRGSQRAASPQTSSSPAIQSTTSSPPRSLQLTVSEPMNDHEITNQYTQLFVLLSSLKAVTPSAVDIAFSESELRILARFNGIRWEGQPKYTLIKSLCNIITNPPSVVPSDHYTQTPSARRHSSNDHADLRRESPHFGSSSPAPSNVPSSSTQLLNPTSRWKHTKRKALMYAKTYDFLFSDGSALVSKEIFDQRISLRKLKLIASVHELPYLHSKPALVDMLWALVEKNQIVRPDEFLNRPDILDDSSDMSESDDEQPTEKPKLTPRRTSKALEGEQKLAVRDNSSGRSQVKVSKRGRPRRPDDDEADAKHGKQKRGRPRRSDDNEPDAGSAKRQRGLPRQLDDDESKGGRQRRKRKTPAERAELYTRVYQKIQNMQADDPITPEQIASLTRAELEILSSVNAVPWYSGKSKQVLGETIYSIIASGSLHAPQSSDTQQSDDSSSDSDSGTDTDTDPDSDSDSGSDTPRSGRRRDNDSDSESSEETYEARSAPKRRRTTKPSTISSPAGSGDDTPPVQTASNLRSRNWRHTAQKAKLYMELYPVVTQLDKTTLTEEVIRKLFTVQKLQVIASANEVQYFMSVNELASKVCDMIMSNQLIHPTEFVRKHGIHMDSQSDFQSLEMSSITSPTEVQPDGSDSDEDDDSDQSSELNEGQAINQTVHSSSHLAAPWARLFILKLLHLHHTIMHMTDPQPISLSDYQFHQIEPCQNTFSPVIHLNNDMIDSTDTHGMLDFSLDHSTSLNQFHIDSLDPTLQHPKYHSGDDSIDAHDALLLQALDAGLGSLQFHHLFDGLSDNDEFLTHHAPQQSDHRESVFRSVILVDPVGQLQVVIEPDTQFQSDSLSMHTAEYSASDSTYPVKLEPADNQSFSPLMHVQLPRKRKSRRSRFKHMTEHTRELNSLSGQCMDDCPFVADLEYPVPCSAWIYSSATPILDDGSLLHVRVLPCNVPESGLEADVRVQFIWAANVLVKSEEFCDPESLVKPYDGHNCSKYDQHINGQSQATFEEDDTRCAPPHQKSSVDFGAEDNWDLFFTPEEYELFFAEAKQRALIESKKRSLAMGTDKDFNSIISPLITSDSDVEYDFVDVGEDMSDVEFCNGDVRVLTRQPIMHDETAATFDTVQESSDNKQFQRNVFEEEKDSANNAPPCPRGGVWLDDAEDSSPLAADRVYAGSKPIRAGNILRPVEKSLHGPPCIDSDVDRSENQEQTMLQVRVVLSNNIFERDEPNLRVVFTWFDECTSVRESSDSEAFSDLDSCDMYAESGSYSDDDEISFYDDNEVKKWLNELNTAPENLGRHFIGLPTQPPLSVQHIDCSQLLRSAAPRLTERMDTSPNQPYQLEANDLVFASLDRLFLQSKFSSSWLTSSHQSIQPTISNLQTESSDDDFDDCSIDCEPESSVVVLNNDDSSTAVNLLSSMSADNDITACTAVHFGGPGLTATAAGADFEDEIFENEFSEDDFDSSADEEFELDMHEALNEDEDEMRLNILTECGKDQERVHSSHTHQSQISSHTFQDSDRAVQHVVTETSISSSFDSKARSSDLPPFLSLLDQATTHSSPNSESPSQFPPLPPLLHTFHPSAHVLKMMIDQQALSHAPLHTQETVPSINFSNSQSVDQSNFDADSCSSLSKASFLGVLEESEVIHHLVRDIINNVVVRLCSAFDTELTNVSHIQVRTAEEIRPAVCQSGNESHNKHDFPTADDVRTCDSDIVDVGSDRHLSFSNNPVPLEKIHLSLITNVSVQQSGQHEQRLTKHQAVSKRNDKSPSARVVCASNHTDPQLHSSQSSVELASVAHPSATLVPTYEDLLRQRQQKTITMQRQQQLKENQQLRQQLQKQQRAQRRQRQLEQLQQQLQQQQRVQQQQRQLEEQQRQQQQLFFQQQHRLHEEQRLLQQLHASQHRQRQFHQQSVYHHHPNMQHYVLQSYFVPLAPSQQHITVPASLPHHVGVQYISDHSLNTVPSRTFIPNGATSRASFQYSFVQMPSLQSPATSTQSAQPDQSSWHSSKRAPQSESQAMPPSLFVDQLANKPETLPVDDEREGLRMTPEQQTAFCDVLSLTTDKEVRAKLSEPDVTYRYVQNSTDLRGQQSSEIDTLSSVRKESKKVRMEKKERERKEEERAFALSERKKARREREESERLEEERKKARREREESERLEEERKKARRERKESERLEEEGMARKQTERKARKQKIREAGEMKPKKHRKKPSVSQHDSASEESDIKKDRKKTIVDSKVSQSEKHRKRKKSTSVRSSSDEHSKEHKRRKKKQQFQSQVLISSVPSKNIEGSADSAPQMSPSLVPNSASFPSDSILPSILPPILPPISDETEHTEHILDIAPTVPAPVSDVEAPPSRSKRKPNRRRGTRYACPPVPKDPSLVALSRQFGRLVDPAITSSPKFPCTGEEPYKKQLIISAQAQAPVGSLEKLDTRIVDLTEEPSNEQLYRSESLEDAEIPWLEPVPLVQQSSPSSTTDTAVISAFAPEQCDPVISDNDVIDLCDDDDDPNVPKGASDAVFQQAGAPPDQPGPPRPATVASVRVSVNSDAREHSSSMSSQSSSPSHLPRSISPTQSPSRPSALDMQYGLIYRELMQFDWSMITESMVRRACTAADLKVVAEFHPHLPSVDRAISVSQVTSLIADNTIERPYGVVPQHSARRKRNRMVARSESSNTSTNRNTARVIINDVVESNHIIRRIDFDPSDEVAASLYRAVYHKLISLDHSQLDENTLRISFDERELQRLARIDPFDNDVSSQDLPTIVLEDFCNGLLRDPNDIFHSISNDASSRVLYEEIDLTDEPSEIVSGSIPEPSRRLSRSRFISSNNNESHSSHSFSVYQYQPEKHPRGRRFTATETWQQKFDWYTAVYDVLCTLTPLVTIDQVDALTHDSLSAIASLHGYVVQKARKAQLVSLVHGFIVDGVLTDPDELPLEPLGVRDRSPEPHVVSTSTKRQRTRPS